MSAAEAVAPPAGGGLADPARDIGGLLDCRILIVDDNRVGRVLLETTLRKAGFTALRVAVDGEEGLRMVFEWHPDLIITDLVMPRVDGFDLCRWVRAEPRFADIPIIAQSALDEVERRGDAFDAGASDLLHKPFNPRELVSRTRVHLERRKLVSRLVDHQRRTAEELTLARGMQSALMPTEAALVDLRARHPLDIASYSEPSSGLGGDLWGIQSLDAASVRLWTADFTGHGVSAALNTFRLHSFLATEGARWREPADWLAAINRFLHDALPRGQFATMLCAVIDFDERSLRVASAAAPLPVVVDRGGDARVLDVAGLPLGIDPRATYDTLLAPFGPGSMLLAFSDALIETPTPDAPCLTPSALAALAARHAVEGPASLVGAILTSLSAAAQGLGDDLTITALLHAEYEP